MACVFGNMPFFEQGCTISPSQIHVGYHDRLVIAEMDKSAPLVHMGYPEGLVTPGRITGAL